MKKLFLAVAAVAMVFATSCKKENVNEPEVPAGDNEFICVIDQNANPQNAPMVEDGMGTMAHIDASNNVWWQQGDKIMYYGNENTLGVGYYTLTCSKMAGDGRAYFSDQTGNGYHFYQGAHEAYYPASLVQQDPIVTTKMITVLPADINLESDKNAGYLPMYGTGSGTHYLSFTNICAVLKIKIPASISNCNKIEVEVGGSNYISGPFTMNGTIAVLDLQHHVSTKFSKTITVNAPGNSFTADSYVYVAMPQGTYNGFKVTLYNGTQTLNSPTAKDGIYVAAGNIYPVTITPRSTNIPADAFYFEAVTNCTIQVATSNITLSGTLQYIRPGDADWTSYTAGTQLSVTAGSKLYFRSTGNNVPLATSSAYHYFDITDGTANIGGNLMYLMNDKGYDNGFDNSSAYNRAFRRLFYQQDNLKDISKLVFPDTISGYCFESTFEDCHNLTSNKIELKATLGQASCYYNMFKNCTTLVANTLTIGLTTITGKSNVCRSMFEGCSRLAPTSITLSATSCGSRCYQDMFKNCAVMNPSDITLLAETLSTYSYYGMFEGCIALDRPVTIKVESISSTSCMQQMFKDCSNLSSVSLPNCTTFTANRVTDWLSGAGTNVQAGTTPTVYCKSSIQSTVQGTVPSTWTVSGTLP